MIHLQTFQRPQHTDTDLTLQMLHNLNNNKKRYTIYHLQVNHNQLTSYKHISLYISYKYPSDPSTSSQNVLDAIGHMQKKCETHASSQSTKNTKTFSSLLTLLQYLLPSQPSAHSLRNLQFLRYMATEHKKCCFQLEKNRITNM